MENEERNENEIPENQFSMFEDEDNIWEKEWKGMPEYIQENQEPMQQVYVSFATRKDVKEFARLMGQNITYKTRSIWFPKVEWAPMMNQRWVDKHTIKTKKDDN